MDVLLELDSRMFSGSGTGSGMLEKTMRKFSIYQSLLLRYDALDSGLMADWIDRMVCCQNKGRKSRYRESKGRFMPYFERSISLLRSM